MGVICFAQKFMGDCKAKCLDSNTQEVDVQKELLVDKVSEDDAKHFVKEHKTITRTLTKFDSHQKTKQLASAPEIIYRGSVMTVQKIPKNINGKIINYEQVQFGGSVHVIPVTKDGKYIFIKEQRVDALEKGFQVRMMSGIIDAGEKPKEAATRELAEEMGLVAQNLKLFAKIEKNNAVKDVRHYFIATELSETASAREDTENIIGTELLTLDEIRKMAQSDANLSPESRTALLQLCGIIKLDKK